MTNHEQPRGGGEDDGAARVPDPEKQATLTAKGYWLTKWVSDGKDRLIKDGIIQESSAVENALRGAHELFTPGLSLIEGGWRRISAERGMRLTVLHPADSRKDPSGYTEFELVDLVIGIGESKALEGSPDRVRVDVYEDGTCHVSGLMGDIPFSVDNPDPATSFADLDAAEMLLGEAKAGLDFVARGLTGQSPQPPVTPAVS